MGLEPQPIETRGRTHTSRSEQRRAAIHVADRIAAEHPHDLDGIMPRLAGRQIASDQGARAELLDLLDVLGLTYEQIRGNQ